MQVFDDCFQAESGWNCQCSSILCKRIFLLDFKEVQERVFEHQKQEEKFRNNGTEMNTESDNRNTSSAKRRIYKIR